MFFLLLSKQLLTLFLALHPFFKFEYDDVVITPEGNIGIVADVGFDPEEETDLLVCTFFHFCSPFLFFQLE
jgi:hypothetical protein